VFGAGMAGRQSVPVTAPGLPILTRLAAVREALTELPAERLAVGDTGSGAAGPSKRPAGSELAAAVLAELTGHLIPRLTHPDSPALVAVTGPTGAGKSTLVNSLAGGSVSPAGPVRPTTRTPVLVHRPEDARWFPGDRRRVPAWAPVEAVAVSGLPPGVAVLDTPAEAGPLLAVADVWLFVTTATRYADAAAWQTLAAVGGRSADLAVVLDRVRPDAVTTPRSELAGLLSRRGLAGAAVLVVAETALVDGRLPAPATLPVRAWLERLSTGRASREAILHRSVAGSVAALAEPLARLDRLVGDPRLHRATLGLTPR